MNTEFEKYISELSPELQEKARECKTMEEFNEFIADNDIEIPEDALDMVAGGQGCESDCPMGGAHEWEQKDVQAYIGSTTVYYKCKKCEKTKEETRTFSPI